MTCTDLERQDNYFNPLPPHGGRQVTLHIKDHARLFQSTPSAWRETLHILQGLWRSGFQSTPSAWRETKACCLCNIRRIYFNPLPPHGGRRVDAQYASAWIVHFNPLPPHGGRPDREAHQMTFFYFNPLPPHGGRPQQAGGRVSAMEFQSTPSAWRETSFFASNHTFHNISIHSLRMEGDSSVAAAAAEVQDFNPLPPHGGRLFSCIHAFTSRFISIHSLRMEGDFNTIFRFCVSIVFQSTPSAWRETRRSPSCTGNGMYFNPLPPHGGRPP